MPPRLPSWGTALRGSIQTRLFSSTPTSLAPPPRNTSSAAALGQLGQQLASASQRQSRGPKSGQTGSELHMNMLRKANSRQSATERQTAMADLRDHKRESALAQQYLKQMPRNWQVGDVYAPHDLSAQEMDKYKRRLGRPKIDIVDTLNIRPKDMYKNFTLVSEFMTTAGQLRTAAHTRLRAVNHRRVAKMVRRAVGMGLHPSTHAHPELLRKNFFPSQDIGRFRK